MDVKSLGYLFMQISRKVMISCEITTLKVNRYQRKSYVLRINFINSCKLIKKSDHAPVGLGPTGCVLLDNVAIS